MFKKVMVFILCITMVIGFMMPTLANAEIYGDFEVSNGVLIKYHGTGGNVVIPDNLGITSIGAEAFFNCSSLTSVSIPNSITSLGDSVFADCHNLISVNLPDSITGISAGLFSSCENLKSISIPNSVRTIGNSAFASCSSLESIIIPNSVTNIGNQAFTWSGLKSVIIPSNVTSILEFTFSNCYNLSSVSLPSSITSIAECAFWDCNKLTSINIPSGVKSIGNLAFSHCDSLISISIPTSVTSIGVTAFEYRNAYFTIYGKSGSYAQSFAQINNIPFVNIDGETNLSIVSTFPANGATNVDNTIKDITLKFNKNININTGTGTIEIREYDTDKSVLTYYMNNISGDHDNAYHIVYKNENDKTEIVLENALRVLDNSKKYYVKIDNNCICEEGISPYNWFTGISDKNQWNFSTNREYITGIQYLAMSRLSSANVDEYEGQKVLDIAQRFGNSKIWSDQSTLYSDLYTKYLSDWKIADVDRNDKTGFYAVAFENMYTNQSVISYRSSNALTEEFKTDWLQNDFPFTFFDEITPQFNDAVNFYKYYSTHSGSGRKISVTGHSLGGGLGLVVSTLYDLDAQLFDAAPTLDVAYYNWWDKMSQTFIGTDGWKYIDHDSVDDIYVGQLEFMYKNAVMHENYYLAQLFFAHDPNALLTNVGDVNLSKAVLYHIFNEDHIVRKEMSNNKFLVLGSTKGQLLYGSSETQYTPLLPPIYKSNVIYGGDGNDALYGYWGNDVLIGGHGNDTMDGNLGNDSYVYWKGDGVDEITDIGGNDILNIYGYDNIDEITIDSVSDNKFVLIKGNSNEIIKISKNRTTNPINSFVIKITTNSGGSKSYKIQNFNTWKNVKNIVAKCPVEMKIYDANNNLVLTLDNSQEKTVYTDFGNFYVMKQNGTNDYIKIANIIDNNYTVKLVGTDNGNMDYSESWYDAENNLKTAIFSDVSITPTTTITTNTHYSSDIVLDVDINNDGLNDNVLQPTDIYTGDITADYINPTLRSSLTGTAGNNGWYTSDVSYKLIAEDNVGVNQIKYTIENVTKEYQNEFTISKEGTTEINSIAEDYNNNSSEILIDKINIDKTAPIITTNIEEGSEFELNQIVPFTFSANDTVSGLESVTSAIESGNTIDTTTVGNKAITVTAIDKAGNQAIKTINYKVIYKYGGILEPINSDGSSIFKLGRTVPIKFQLKDNKGVFINNASIRLYIENISDEVTGSVNEADSFYNSNTDNIFRYDADTNQYIYNLSTKDMYTGVWKLRIVLNDGTEKHVYFLLK